MTDVTHDTSIDVRLARLLRMALDLEVKPAQRDVIAERYDITEAQVDEDIAMLKAAGVVIYHGSKGYYARLHPLPKDELSVIEVAKELSLSVSVVYEELSRGRLVGRRDRYNRWRIAREAVEDYQRDYRWRTRRRPWSLKLTPSDIQAIRERRAAGESVVKIATSYDVVPNTIYRVLRGDTWNSDE